MAGGGIASRRVEKSAAPNRNYEEEDGSEEEGSQHA